MTIKASLLPKGLFGGLLAELRTDLQGLTREIENNWDVQRPVALADELEWKRGGAETFIAVSRIEVSQGGSEMLLGKAFVGWGVSPTQQQQRWEQRRAEFRQIGIPVPRLIARYDGLSVEEFIADSVAAAPLLSQDEAAQLGAIAAKLDSMRLRPLSMLADVRSAGGQLMYVDFGSDLVPSTSEDQWIASFASGLPPLASRSFLLAAGKG